MFLGIFVKVFIGFKCHFDLFFPRLLSFTASARQELVSTFSSDCCSAMCTLPASISSSRGYVVSGCSGTITQSACSLSCDTSGGYSGSPAAMCSAPGEFSVIGTCDRTPHCFFFFMFFFIISSPFLPMIFLVPF